MAKNVRYLLALLLSMLLPLAGVAGTMSPAAHCHGHESMSAATAIPADHVTMHNVMHSAMDTATKAMPGKMTSCYDAEKSAQLGYKVCKAGHEGCQAPVLMAVPVLKTAVVPSGPGDLGSYTPPPLRSRVDTLWRPPRV